VIASVVVPFAQRFERIANASRAAPDFRIFPEFCDGRRSRREIALKKRATTKKNPQERILCPQQIHGLREPRVSRRRDPEPR